MFKVEAEMLLVLSDRDHLVNFIHLHICNFGIAFKGYDHT